MRINVGVSEEEKKLIFITDEDGENIGELEISDKAFEVMLEELSKE